MKRHFRELIEKKWADGKFACVGLDTELAKIPHDPRTCFTVEALVTFNMDVIDATFDLVCAYKPNIAFYEAEGIGGLQALLITIQYIQRVAPDVPVILDAKRADIGNTNAGYTKMAFGEMKADAITVNPYFGGKALEPFLTFGEKGIFVLCRTSNEGSGEIQDQMIAGTPLYEYVAQRVATTWNANNNCGLVVGATAPDELEKVRTIAHDLPILIPGIGVQGGDLERAVKVGKDSRNKGMIINSSRGIIYAENPRKATLELDQAIRSFL